MGVWKNMVEDVRQTGFLVGEERRKGWD